MRDGGGKTQLATLTFDGADTVPSMPWRLLLSPQRAAGGCCGME